MNIHAVLTQQEQNIAVIAIDFYLRYNTGAISSDDFQQARDLANKLATLK